MIQVTLSVGSNCGDRSAFVAEALQWLKSSVLMQTECSEIYETPCALKTGKPYKNAVIRGFYSGTGFQLEDLLKEKEHEMGRNTECRERGDVPIDIDIVIMDGEVVKSWDYRQKFFQIGYQYLEAR